MQQKVAVYAGTRNIYKDMLPSLKSLLIHSDVNKVYFLIEDDEFPYELPQEVECINVSGQTWFPQNGPNFNNILSYMVLLRAAYTKLFPNIDKILSIDIDTIVNENISDLWDIDISDYYLAAVQEQIKNVIVTPYINMGVALINLEKLRQDKKDDELIEALNHYWYKYKEQDCFNELLHDKILFLPSDYNSCKQAAMPIMHEKITHFAGFYDLKQFPHFNYYRDLPISEIKRNTNTPITLDVIIPTYKNKTELRRTLNSITIQENVNTIVIDDASELDYSDILQEYPFIHFYQLEKNSGPGMARQYGIEHSNGTYITFLDSGDYFYENGLENILKQIQENTYIKLYTWSYVYDNNNVLCDIPDSKTIGSVYKRSFIEMYNICFCAEGSYANEDYGWTRSCRIILNNWRQLGFQEMSKHIKIPIFYEHIDKNSVTKKNNKEYSYTKMPEGILVNGLHAINIAQKNKVRIENILVEYNYLLAQEYYCFLLVLNNRPDLAMDTWAMIQKFYLNFYATYEKYALKTLNDIFRCSVLPKLKNDMKKWNCIPKINIMHFVQELKEEPFMPIRYFNN